MRRHSPAPGKYPLRPGTVFRTSLERASAPRHSVCSLDLQMVSEFDRRDIAFDDRVEAGKELARRIIVAVPVGSLQACRDLEGEADEVICARLPRDFIAVGKWYLDFSETADAEVIRLLQPAARPHAAPGR